MPGEKCSNINNKRKKAKDLFGLIFLLFQWDEEITFKLERGGKNIKNLSSQKLVSTLDARLMW